jgi:predicted dinucleotide-binding enzyme
VEQKKRLFLMPLIHCHFLNLKFFGMVTNLRVNFCKLLPKSFVFKAFNTVGLNHLGNPDGSLVPGRADSLGPLKMLYCGPLEQREAAAQVISAVGFHPVYVGTLRYSRNLEAIAELWIHLAIPGVGSSENWGMGFHFEPTGV